MTLAFGEKTFFYLSCSSLALQVELLKDEAEDLGEKVVNGRPILQLLQLLAFCPAAPQTQRVLTRLGACPLAARLLVARWHHAAQVGDVRAVGDRALVALYPLCRVPVRGNHLRHLLGCGPVVAVRLVQLTSFWKRLGKLYEVGDIEEVVAVPAAEDGGHVEAAPATRGLVRLTGPRPCNGGFGVGPLLAALTSLQL